MSQRLEQLYFTWSTIGYGDITGFRMRAASPGVADITSERYRSLKPFLSYYLPPGTDIYQADAEKSPFCLIYARAGQEHIIAQKIYKGKDAYNRPGVYFVHLLAGLPEDFVACDAIALWRSTFWDTSDANVPNSLDLPLIQSNILTQQKGVLSEHDLLGTKDYLPLLIQAYLSLSEQQKIYIAAPADMVATLIWGLTQCLPRTMQRDLTFSTYEDNVLRVSTRIVGTCEPQTAILKGYIKSPRPLPQECYSDRSWVIDCYISPTPPRDYVPQEVIEYSLFATDCLISGRKKELDEVLATAERIEVKDTNALLFVFKSATSTKPLTRAEVTGLLGNKELTTTYLQQESFQRSIIRLAIDNPQWWETEAKPALLRLRRPFHDRDSQPAREALSQFGRRVAAELYTAMVKNDVTDSEFLMRMLSDIIPPDKEPRPWVQLLDSFAKDTTFSPAEKFDWETRKRFLECWAYGKDLIQDKSISPWLQMGKENWREFGHFLRLNAIPNKWYQIAFQELLLLPNIPIPTKQVVLLFNDKEYYYPFCLDALRDLMQSSQTQPAALRCFSSLVAGGYKQVVLMLATLLGEGEIVSTHMDDFIRAAQLRPKEKVELLEQHHQQLLPSTSKAKASPEVVKIITDYLSALTLEKLADEYYRSIQTVLAFLYEHPIKLPPNVVAQVQDWLLISDSLVRGNTFPRLNIEKRYLKSLSEAIAHLHLQAHKRYREWFFLTLMVNISTSEQLSCVLDTLTPAMGSRLELFHALAATRGENYTPQVPYEKFMPYVEEVLAHSTTLKNISSKTKFLDAFLKVLLKKVDKKTFEKIEIAVYQWSPDLSGEWDIYFGKTKPKPKSLLQNVGDNVMEAGGALLEKGANFIQHLPSKPLQGQPLSPTPQDAPSQEPPLADEPPSVQQEVTPPSQRGQVVSTVNETPIYVHQCQKIYRLKDGYISMRLAELKDAFKTTRAKQQDVSWIADEQNELLGHDSMEAMLRVLEDDILVADALRHFQVDPTLLLAETLQRVKQQKSYTTALGNRYTDDDMREVLLVFLRWRTLAEYLRVRGKDSKEWLDQQRNGAKFATVAPLPLVE